MNKKWLPRDYVQRGEPYRLKHPIITDDAFDWVGAHDFAVLPEFDDIENAERDAVEETFKKVHRRAPMLDEELDYFDK